MIVVTIVLGLIFLLLLSIGDAVGAAVLGFVLVIFGWVLWGDRRERET